MRWKLARQITQGVFLVGFLALLLTTRDPLREVVPVEILLRLDPLLAVTSMIAARAFIGAMAISLVVVVLTILLGRVFCGWICPLGTTIDVFDRLALRRRRPAETMPILAQGKSVTLAAAIVLAVFGVHVVGFLDPLCIATRSYAGVVLPILSETGDLALEGLDALGAPRAADGLAEGLDSIGLARRQSPSFDLQILHGMIFAAVLLLSLIRKRFWCRALCPLGGGLALLSRWRLLGPVSGDGCDACTRCERGCPTGALAPAEEDRAAFEKERISDPGECIQCMSCLPQCRESSMTLGRPRRGRGRTEVVPSRRAFLRTAAASVVVAPLVSLQSHLAATTDLRAIRPPGAADEPRFLDLCIRCGQCSRACPTGGLHPSGLEGGLEGLFTPRLVPRYVEGAGYCEFECNLCGQICPTGAIPDLPLEEKKETLIGIARFDENRCIPFERDVDCVVCEEHCPTPEKAIRTREEIVAGGPEAGSVVHRPHVVEDRCIGCGICEAVCPLPGPSAIRVERRE